MYCTSCGKEIADKAVICVHCGAFVKGCRPPVKPAEIQPAKPLEVPPETNTPAPRKKFNGLSLAGFILAILSIALGMIFVYIHVYQYTGVYLQFYCAIPLAVALGLSIAGTVKAKKLKSGLGFGIAGIIISGGTFIGAILYFAFMVLMAYLAVILFMFIIALL